MTNHVFLGSRIGLCLFLLGLVSCSDPAQETQSVDVNQLVQKGNYPDALVKLSEVLVNHPNDPDLLYNIAVIQRMQGKLEDARRTLAKAEANAPNDDNIHLLLTEIILELGNEQEAWDRFVQISESARQTSRAQYLKGVIHTRMGDYPQAESSLRTAQSLGDNRAIIQSALAFVLIKQQRLDEARALLQQASAQPSLSFDDRRQMAESYLALGETKQAETIALELQKERPDDARVLTLLGKIEMLLLNFNEAESAFTRAIASPNATPWTKVAYAEMLFAAQRENEALEKALEAEEQMTYSGETVRDPSLYNLLATLYARKEQPLLARKYLNLSQQVRLQPRVAELIKKMDQAQ